MTAHVAQNSGNNEWYSPPEIVEAGRRLLGGFDLDPATSEMANRTVRASKVFTVLDNGLLQRWPIGRIWMNPPYSQPQIGQFAARFAEEIGNGSSGLVLVNNATETAWFQTLAAASSAICLVRKRVRFVSPDGKRGESPLQGQAILYAGDDVKGFIREFGAFGMIVLCERPPAPEQLSMLGGADAS